MTEYLLKIKSVVSWIIGGLCFNMCEFVGKKVEISMTGYGGFICLFFKYLLLEGL